MKIALRILGALSVLAGVAAVAQTSRPASAVTLAPSSGRTVLDSRGGIVGYLIKPNQVEVPAGASFVSIGDVDPIAGIQAIDPSAIVFVFTTSNCSGHKYLLWNGMLGDGYIIGASSPVTNGTLYYPEAPAQKIVAASRMAFNGTCSLVPSIQLTVGLAKTRPFVIGPPPYTVK